jgi:hypothetical protein
MTERIRGMFLKTMSQAGTDSDIGGLEPNDVLWVIDRCCVMAATGDSESLCQAERIWSIWARDGVPTVDSQRIEAQLRQLRAAEQESLLSS